MATEDKNVPAGLRNTRGDFDAYLDRSQGTPYWGGSYEAVHGLIPEPRHRPSLDIWGGQQADKSPEVDSVFRVGEEGRDSVRVQEDTEAVVRRERYIDGSPEWRKGIPLASGCLDYFPDALAAVAEVSVAGNNQHNPGQPLHWARGKSTDFRDTIARHLLQAGTFDNDGLRHSAKLAWRALANLQVELEQEYHLTLPRAAKE